MPVGPEDFDKGVAAAKRYATELKEKRPLAEQGNAEAQAVLGFMYDEGKGVPQDFAEALKWYHRAAEQGHAHAQNNLGLMYAKGEGVPQDYVQAHFWFNLAASKFDEPEGRKMSAGNCDLAATEMTPAQIAEAQRLAREWKPKTWAEVQAMERQAGKQR